MEYLEAVHQNIIKENIDKQENTKKTKSKTFEEFSLEKKNDLINNDSLSLKKAFFKQAC